MVIGRRDLLRAGAAVAASVALAGCSPTERGTTASSSTRAPRPSASASTPAPTGPVPFHERVQPGSLYFGASLPYYRSLEAWEQDLGATLSVHRSYFHPVRSEAVNLVQQCREDLASGRLPHVSIKLPRTWQAVAAGEADDWLRSLLRPLGEDGGPVILTLHHEPENDAGPPGMLPRDFVAMQSRAIGLAADLAPLVTVVPVLQHWTFEVVRPLADPAAWMVPDAEVMGLDIYNPWSPANGKPWRSFGSKVDEAREWLGDVPVAVGEYGCREDPANPGLAAAWLRDAAEYARDNGVVSMSYFNSDLNAPDGSWELTGRTERAFADLLAADWVVRTT